MEASGRETLAVELPEATGGTVTPPENALRESIDLRVAATLDAIRRVPGNQRRGEKVFPHPFPARMPMAVAEIAVDRLSKPGDWVLDPMVGSGTSTRAATLVGRNAIGVDTDPLAVILARTFSSLPRANVLHDVGNAVLDQARARQRSLRLQRRRRAMPQEDQAFLDYWFPTDVQSKLFCLLDAMEEVVPNPERAAFFTIFSSLIIARSRGVSYALDLSRTRPHKDPGKEIRDPFNLWAQRILEFARYASRAVQSPVSPDLRCGDARNLTHVASDSIDLVLSSPPYGTAIDYIRASKFSLVFLACPLSALREIRGTSIGSERGLRETSELQAVEAQLPRRASRETAILRRYLVDLTRVLDESARTLRRGGAAIFAVGPSMVSSTRYDSADVMEALGTSVGLRYVGGTRRTLSQSNRSLPPPKRTSGDGAIHKRMNCEYYVGFVKD